MFDGRYLVKRVLGEGGMGRVYEATQLSLGRQVAIKVIVPARRSAESAVHRFRREALLATKLTSPHVVRVFDFAVEPTTETPYIVMELIQGQSLAETLERFGVLPPDRSLLILIQLARALAEAEHLGLVHRDIKPDNVLLVYTPDGADFVKLADFGLARPTRNVAGLGGPVTSEGQVVGTPQYMSPEQVSGKTLDIRSDLYSIGCLLFELITGRPPFAEIADPMQVLMAHLTMEPPQLPVQVQGRIVPQEIRELCASLLAKDREARPRSCLAVLEVLLRQEGALFRNSGRPLESTPPAAGADSLTVSAIPSQAFGASPSSGDVLLAEPMGASSEPSSPAFRALRSLLRVSRVRVGLAVLGVVTVWLSVGLEQPGSPPADSPAAATAGWTASSRVGEGATSSDPSSPGARTIGKAVPPSPVNLDERTAKDSVAAPLGEPVSDRRPFSDESARAERRSPQTLPSLPLAGASQRERATPSVPGQRRSQRMPRPVPRQVTNGELPPSRQETVW